MNLNILEKSKINFTVTGIMYHISCQTSHSSISALLR